MNYFAVAVMKPIVTWKEEFISAFGSRGRVRDGRGSVAAGSRSRNRKITFLTTCRNLENPN